MDTLFAYLVETNDASDLDREHLLRKIVDVAKLLGYFIEFDNREVGWDSSLPGGFDLIVKNHRYVFEITLPKSFKRKAYVIVKSVFDPDLDRPKALLDFPSLSRFLKLGAY